MIPLMYKLRLLWIQLYIFENLLYHYLSIYLDNLLLGLDSFFF